MSPHLAADRSRWLGGLLGFALAPSVLLAQGPSSRPRAAVPSAQVVAGPESRLLAALKLNPVTEPYAFRVSRGPRNGGFILAGRVGTRYVHDVAVRTAIDLGIGVRDDLTIDTAEAYRAAAVRDAGGATRVVTRGFYAGGVPYVYPPPLFGRVDDPFFGFEPPLVSYPPGWAALTEREPISSAALAAANPLPASGPGALPGGVELELDPLGVAVLRGKVASLSDRVALGQEVAKAKGVTQVINLLEIDVSLAQSNSSDVPPPPPQPAIRMPRALPGPAGEAEKEKVVTPADLDPVTQRVNQALGRRPALASLPIRVSVRDGVATLTGKVPTAYEAMLAFRAAQQTPGVTAAVDRLEFLPPDVDRPNPLRSQGRPEDLNPYLLFHARRQLGDLAHVDRIDVNGDRLDVRGTVTSAADRDRAEAALRSISIFRGFRIEPDFQAE